MARYIVVRVEDNDKADTLLERLRASRAIRIIGLFAAPTKFCPGKEVCGKDRRVIRSQKTGLTHCRVCRLPVSTLSHSPKNLLLPLDLHERLVDFRITVWEPYEHPVDKYGQKTIDIKRMRTEEAEAKLRKGRRRQTRRLTRERNGN